MTYDEFKTKYLGKKVDFDLSYGAQCVDLYREYCKSLGFNQSPPVQGAADIWTSYLQKSFERIPNTPLGIPKKGDIVIFGRTFGQYGHVGIVDSASLWSLTALEQNNPLGSPVRLGKHYYKHVLGWLRPKQAPVAPKEIGIALIGLKLPITATITQKVMEYSGNTMKLVLNDRGGSPIQNFDTDEAMVKLGQVNPPENYALIGCVAQSGFAKTSFHPALGKSFAICPPGVSEDVVIHELLHCFRKYINFHHLGPYIEDVEWYGPNWRFFEQYQQLVSYRHYL